MLEWVFAHWEEICAIAALVILAGERIARLTPTETDNRILKAVRSAARILGVDVPDNPGRDRPGTKAPPEKGGTTVKSPGWVALAALLLALMTLAACASRIAETPAQRVYALQSEYNAALAVATAYESLPRCKGDERHGCSDPDLVADIREADRYAFTAIAAAQNAVRVSKTTGGGADESTILLAISAAREGLAALQTILNEEITR